uniref:Sulfotransfer_1 domain-containing protein n=1 Tax=Parastrongyloides trichosuri TaxID=131310 RepID=A0A0N4Z8F3_PARTI
MESFPEDVQNAIIDCLFEMGEHANEVTMHIPKTKYPKLFEIDGILQQPFVSKKNLYSARELVPRDDDVFVVTTPKSGTTWNLFICLNLLRDNYMKGGSQEMFTDAPFLESFTKEVLDMFPVRRIFKTHFYYDWIPKSKTAKYIYTVRNPKDVLISYFHHIRNMKINEWEDGDFNVMFDMFMNDRIESGGYFMHVKSWLPHIHEENVLFLVYEEMCRDLKGNIIKIAKFLGGKANKVLENEKILDEVVETCTFKSMKDKNDLFSSDITMRTKTFIRKGGSKNWKKYLTKEQSDLIDAKFNEYFKGTILENLWIDEMTWDD